jgi:hypothetical protein
MTNDEMQQIQRLWISLSNDAFELTVDGMISVERFGGMGLSFDDLVQATKIAFEKVNKVDREGHFKYFCKICWNKLRSPDGPYTKARRE